MNGRDDEQGGTATGGTEAELERFRGLLAEYEAASRTLQEWAAGAMALTLLRTGVASGIVEAARSPRTPADIAAVTGLDERRVADVCLALDAHGVLDREGEAYRLAPDFAIVAAPGAPQDLGRLLDGIMVRVRGLEAAASSDRPYTALPAEDMLGLAAGIATSPLSAAGNMSGRLMSRSLPELGERWQAGGHHLELGCGVGNNLLSIVVNFPRVTAVGVEIDAGTLEEARRRAEALGVLDRVELRRMDARDLRDEAAFDTAQWSQFFFPMEGRPEILAALFRALRPGGYVGMALLADPPTSTEALRDPGGRSDVLHRLLFSSWGIPVRTEADLRGEAEGAGFEVVRVVPGPPRGRNLTRGILLARRPER